MLEPNDLKTWTILIVDDEPDNLEVIAQSLNFFGATVQTAKDGLLGLKALETYEPNFILLDLSMPNMDGWQMRAKVKENPKTAHLPVIALTAHAMAGDRQRAIDAGFDGYLTKPVNVVTLVQDVKNVLNEHFAKKPPIAAEPPKVEITSVEEKPEVKPETPPPAAEPPKVEIAPVEERTEIKPETPPPATEPIVSAPPPIVKAEEKQATIVPNKG